MGKEICKQAYLYVYMIESEIGTSCKLTSLAKDNFGILQAGCLMIMHRSGDATTNNGCTNLSLAMTQSLSKVTSGRMPCDTAL